MLVLVVTPFAMPIEAAPAYARLLTAGEVVELPDLDAAALIEAGYVLDQVPPGWREEVALESPRGELDSSTPEE